MSKTSLPDEAREVLRYADILHDALQVSAAYDQMARDIEQQLGDLNPVVLAVMVGGMIPAAQLLHRLEMPLEIDYIHATRYRSGLQGHELEWRIRPKDELRGRHVLVVDDILDEGHTLGAIMTTLRELETASVRSAVLVNKVHDRRVEGVQADFSQLQVPDRYVFGCGMDYKGWYRQLPAIYAVANGD
jgi:hypoxanthine phosphoribosyltransferase